MLRNLKVRKNLERSIEMLGVPSALISNEHVYLFLVSKLGFKLRVLIFVLETEETSILISFPVLKSQLRQKLIQDAT